MSTVSQENWKKYFKNKRYEKKTMIQNSTDLIAAAKQDKQKCV